MSIQPLTSYSQSFECLKCNYNNLQEVTSKLFRNFKFFRIFFSLPQAPSIELLFLGASVQAGMSVAQMSKLWKNFMLNPQVWESLDLTEKVARGLKKSISKQRCKAIAEHKPLTDFAYKSRKDGQVTERKGQRSIPIKEFNTTDFQFQYEASYRKLQDIVEIHRKLHPSKKLPKKLNMVLTNDGVAESNSSNRSLNAWSVRFHGCEYVYPFRVSKADKGKTCFDDDLDFVIEEIK